ncbi:MAG: magnesium transporter MgtC [Thermodesulfovibrio sp.]|nr:magnesium transporter MgtC [Thermodesulfovibrio sp.]
MIPTYEIIFKLLLGTLLGGIIGFERQTHGRPAGFRTQLLVCVACVLIMMISESYYSKDLANPNFTRIDPTRLAAGAMTGVGFLGAGVILKTGVSIQGLTTAACIWIVSAIGLAIGAGQYVAGIAGFIITFFSLWVLRLFESRIPTMIYKYVTLVTDERGDEQAIADLFKERGFKIIKMDYKIKVPEKEKTYVFTVTAKDGVRMRDIIDDVTGLAGSKKLEISS